MPCNARIAGRLALDLVEPLAAGRTAPDNCHILFHSPPTVERAVTPHGPDKINLFTQPVYNLTWLFSVRTSYNCRSNVHVTLST